MCECVCVCVCVCDHVCLFLCVSLPGGMGRVTDASAKQNHASLCVCAHTCGFLCDSVFLALLLLLLLPFELVNLNACILI